MKNIVKSLFVIVAVLTIASGSTIAYFSDTVTIAGNSFTTGTIDIDVDGQDTGHQSFEFTDMKPGFVEFSNFTINNKGTNPANIIKKVTITSDPAILAAVIDYKLNVEVYDGVTLKWFQMLYNYDVTLASIAGQNMFLGMLPAGWSMKVYESYRMQTGAGNQYQGQTLAFNIDVIAEQLQGNLTLENKTGSPNWDIIQGDGKQGTLTYGVMDSKFNYSFTGTAPQANTNYTLVIGSDSWVAGTTLGAGLTDGAGNIILNGSVELGTVTNQKVWLILSSHWNGSNMIGWDGSKYLFETGLIDYYDSL